MKLRPRLLRLLARRHLPLLVGCLRPEGDSNSNFIGPYPTVVQTTAKGHSDGVFSGKRLQ